MPLIDVFVFDKTIGPIHFMRMVQMAWKVRLQFYIVFIAMFYSRDIVVGVIMP